MATFFVTWTIRRRRRNEHGLARRSRELSACPRPSTQAWSWEAPSACALWAPTPMISASNRSFPPAIRPSRSPAIADILTRWNAQVTPLSAIGIASFGPLELRRESPGYGRLGATTKQYWDYCDLVGFFARRFSAPIGVTTDVIGAALAEGRWGDARGLSHFAYVTVGTGVGVGVVVGGKPLSGCHHPELGHVRAVRLPGDDWPGICGFHGACVEGLASGPAIAARAGINAAELPGDSPVWDTVTHALAQLLHILVMSVGPQRILIGGGVMNTRPAAVPENPPIPGQESQRLHRHPRDPHRTRYLHCPARPGCARRSVRGPGRGRRHARATPSHARPSAGCPRS